MAQEDIEFASGGERCAAWFFRPEGAPGPFPCVVMATGFSCVRDQGLVAFGERFAASGIATLAFDYRCFGDSGGEPRQLASPRRQRGDVRAALALARSLDSVDTNRIALWGYSFGGAHVQSLALSEPGLSAAICVAPVIDTQRTVLHIGGISHMARLTVAGTRDGIRALRRAEPYLVPAAGPPGSDAVISTPQVLDGFEQVTPPGSTWRNEACARVLLEPPYKLVRKARRIAIPILYCIAEDDDVTPPALGMRVAKRPPRGELRTYPGGHFDPFLGGTFERMAADQVEFLDRCWGAERGGD